MVEVLETTLERVEVGGGVGGVTYSSTTHRPRVMSGPCRDSRHVDNRVNLQCCWENPLMILIEVKCILPSGLSVS